MGDDEAAPPGGRVEQVPIEYEDDFQRDPEFALRQIVGIAVDSIAPFIAEPGRIVEAIDQGEALGLEHWVNSPDVNLGRDGFPRWHEQAIPSDTHALRFAHIDLSRTRDACGIAIVKFLGMTRTEIPETPDTFLHKPKFAAEVAISIKPDPDNELILSELRQWLMQPIDRFGLVVHSISMDGYQSADSLQIFRHRGIRASEQSVDRTSESYEYLKESLYDGRVAMVDSPTLRRELYQLERNPHTGLVDHPPRGSKDVADAVCGAIYTASRSRVVRTQTGYYDRQGDPVRQQLQRPEGRRRR
jgi:hypothetical protein